MRYVIPAVLSWAVLSGAAFAIEPVDVTVADIGAANIVIVGEVHDNPAHHTAQAAVVAQVQPKAIVWEMLTPAQAGLVTPELIDNATAMAERLDWDAAGWPDFNMYHQIFAAAPDAISYGAAVPRDLAQAVMHEPLGAAFEAAAAYGLDRDLSDAHQLAREELQRVAHCDALPKDLLPAMVKVQRLRDATLAQATVRALADTGGPVVVITGNGHARKDWGVPSYLAAVAPKARVWSIGQAEDGNAPDGGFDVVWYAPAQERPDPCAAFK